MAVYSVNLLWSGRTGSADFMMRRTYTRVYEVYTTSPADDAVTAGTAPGLLPVMGAAHPEDPAAVVVRRSPSQDDADPLRWLVQIDYDTQPTLPTAAQPNDGTTTTVADQPESPLDRPPVWKITFQQVQEVVRTAYLADEDGNNVGGGKPVFNSAGLPFDPPPMVEVSRPVIQVTKNYATFDLAALQSLQDSVNSTEWFSVNPRCARCIGVEANSAYENGVTFWPHTFTLMLKADTWDLRVLDAGFSERIQVGTDPITSDPVYEWRRIKDANGNEVTEPVPLNGSGEKLAPGDPETYLVFSIYRQVDYNTVVF